MQHCCQCVHVLHACRLCVQALSEYMRVTHYVCLGDVIALKLKSTPLLGPMLTSAVEKAGGGGKAATEVETVAFLKIFELSAHQEPIAHKADVRPPPPLFTLSHRTVFSALSCHMLSRSSDLDRL